MMKNHLVLSLIVTTFLLTGCKGLKNDGPQFNGHYLVDLCEYRPSGGRTFSVGPLAGKEANGASVPFGFYDMTVAS